MSTFKKKVKKKRRRGEVVRDGDVDEVEVRLSASSYESACSALSHLYTDAGLNKEAISPELWKKLSSYKKGSRRMGASEKKDFGLKLSEGKRPLSYQAYKRLATLLFRSEKAEHIAAHAFLVLEWNLIARAENCVGAKIDHIHFHRDALLFNFAKTKTDQEGTKNIDHPWHVYANPIDPAVCPLLALSRHIMVHPTILTGQCNLFEGMSQYERFNRIFNDVVIEYREDFVALGICPEDFGTHSIRKGAATFVSTGCTVSPPMASICLRACWTLGGVNDRYIKYEKAGDQYVGRVVSGLPVLGKEFAVSPPHFDFSTCENEVEEERKTFALNNWIKSRIPQEAKSNESIFYLIKMCLSSFIYHREFLEKNLHQASAVRCTVFWVEDIPSTSHVKIIYPWEESSNPIEITGIPPHTTLLAEIEGLRKMVSGIGASIASEMKGALRDELDAREVGGTAFAQSSLILSKLDLLVKRGEDTMMRCRLENESASIGEVFDNEISFVLEEEVEGLETDNFLSAQTREQIIREKTRCQLKRRKLTLGLHHGKLNPLPSTWTFPKKMSVIHLINMWLLGNKKENVPPLKLLSSRNVDHLKSGPGNLSKMKQVLLQVESFGRERGLWQSNNVWNGERVTKLWSGIWKDLDQYLRTESSSNRNDVASAKMRDKSRKGQVSWRTCYNNMQKKGIFKGNRRRRRNQK